MKLSGPGCRAYIPSIHPTWCIVLDDLHAEDGLDYLIASRMKPYDPGLSYRV